METFKVRKDFSPGRYSDMALELKAVFVATQMNGNPHFPNPTPTLVELQTGADNFLDSIKKAEHGTHEDTVIKKNFRAALEKMMRKLADYVQLMSDGDEAVILSSGFDVNKKPAAVGELDNPENFSVKVGVNKGTLVAACDAVDHATYYEVEYTDAPVTDNSIWVKATSTRSSILIENLISGKQYALRMAGVGTSKSRNWSSVITSFVL